LPDPFKTERRDKPAPAGQKMMYQFEHDYRFDSSKIESAFGLQPTPYIQGIGASLRSET